MTEATIRGVPGMKSVLDMPVMQVRDRIDDYVFAFAHFPLCAQISPPSFFSVCLLFPAKEERIFVCARADETQFAKISRTRERVKRTKTMRSHLFVCSLCEDESNLALF